MLSFEEAGRFLDEEAAHLPEEIFRSLNGGVNLLPDKRRDSDGLYTMVMYFRNAMGRYVEIYYGSFQAVYGEDDEAFRKGLGDTLRHELTHHLENLAGDRSLEKWDDRHREELLDKMDGGQKDSSTLFAGGYAGPGESSVMRRRRRPISGEDRR